MTGVGSPAELKAALAQATHERDEALAQQAATAEVLKVISRSTFDLQSVLDTLIETACRLCEAGIGTIRYEEGTGYRLAATFGCRPEWRQHFAGYSSKPDRTSVFGQTILKGGTVHIPDVLEDADYSRPQAQKLMGLRAALGVPLVREGRVFGVVNLFRTTPRAFTNKQIELVETFADQAVIAIENARLFEAEQQRSAELAEALEQQTATAEVLKVISSSPGDLQPVFDTILINATRICEAEFGILDIYDGGMFYAAASRNAPQPLQEFHKQRGKFEPTPGTPLDRLLKTKQVVHSTDDSGAQVPSPPARLAGAKSHLAVPMLKDETLLGAIIIYRQEVRPFTDKQIDLVKNFAAQAVIAIENARLLGELRQRTDDLAEALEQQTATSEVLQVISSSPGELTPVFESMLNNACRICQADAGNLFLCEPGGLRTVAVHGETQYTESWQNRPLVAFDDREDLPINRIARTKSLVHVADLRTEPAYAARHPRAVALVEAAGARTLLNVPLVRDNELIGVFGIFRQQVRPFTDKQIELVSNFAAQAVIAIENARLLTELRESLEQQTATADVLKVISRSTFDLQTVLDTLTQSATKLCAADKGVIFLRDGDVFRFHANHGFTEEAVRYGRANPLRAGTESSTGRVALTGKISHIHDVLADPDYKVSGYQRAFGYRTNLGVPLLRDGAVIGVFALTRDEVAPFTDKQIELVTTFADQAVIAIENARLLNELRESLERQTATSEVLGVISSSPGELPPVFRTILQNAVRLCGAKFGNLYLREGDGFRAAAMHNAPPAYAEQRTGIVHPSPNTTIGQVAQTKQPAQIADITKLPGYLEGDPWLASAVSLAGYRSTLCVPMLHDDELIGGITIFRQEAGPFADKQIELLTNFAKQAVIAIENARLLSELRESLERQTATSEVLRVISGSQDNLQPVFDTILANATRICEAKFGHLQLLIDGKIQLVAELNTPPELAEFQEKRGPFQPEAGTPLHQVLQTKQAVYTADVVSDMVPGAAGKFGGARSIAIVPMLRDGDLIGTITIFRQEVRPFTAKQIELVTNFAAQAVIAIENARLLNELRETLERQTATSEVLKVISSSPGSLEPVFDAMLEHAVRICQAQFGVMHRFAGEEFAAVAMLNIPPALAEFLRRRGLAKAIPGSDMDTLYKSKQLVHTIDMLESPSPSPPAKLAGARTQLAVPMIKDDELVGAIVIYRQEVLPFTDKQVELVQNFAAQAVIAIENARLLNELRETLERQTATSEVLKVISGSPGELDPVFNAMLENATRICEAKFGNLFLLEGERYRAVAVQGEPQYAQYWRDNPVVEAEHTKDIPLDRVRQSRQRLHILDMRQDASYIGGNWRIAALVDTAGARTFLAVPLLKEGGFIGAIAIYRQEVRPFTVKQIELVENFAAQAVIAIENARLLNELRESLDQQTATSEVLEVISSSPGALEPVFQAMLENATRICEAKIGILWGFEDGAYNAISMIGITPAYAEYLRRGPFRPGSTTGLGRVASGQQTVHIVDTLEDQAYADRDPFRIATAELGGARTLLNVPMFKEGKLIGAIGIYRQEVRPFSEKQIELVTNFASQAVIAIENTRLLNELRESLEQQTATSEVLKVISSSPGELAPVFEAMLENATRICRADSGTIYRYDGEKFHTEAMFGESPELMEFRRQRGPFMPPPGVPLDRLLRTLDVVHRADDKLSSTTSPSARLGGARSHLAVPMFKDDDLIGAFTIYRKDVQPFTEKQIALVKNFAAQAVIAIENTRLLNELRESLERQTATSEVLKVVSSSPGELEPVFASLLGNATKLCEASYGAMWLREGDVVRNVSFFGDLPEPFHELWHAGSVIPTSAEVPVARCMRTGEVIYVPDLKEDHGYRSGAALARGAVDVGGIRTLLAVPLLKEGGNIGGITIYRREVKPFTDKQIELVKNFAAQAVIAIENARLLNELRQRTDDLTESLEQQTATSEVLRVISASPGELQPVFNVMLENATRICGATFGSLVIYEGTHFRRVAAHNAPAPLVEDWKRTDIIDLKKSASLGPMIADRRVFHILDLAEQHPQDPLHRLAGARTFLAVPMLKDDQLIGVIGIYRQAVQPFTDKQIALVTNFAAQAVIAIENTRLLNELRETLERQTATSEVLEVISSSPGELEPVFDAVLENATRICSAAYGSMALAEGDVFRRVALHNASPEFSELHEQLPIIDPRTISPVKRLVETRQVVHVADIATEFPDDPIAKSNKARTLLLVPMFKDESLIGMIAIYRREIRPFGDKQIELVKNFASQAVIAIENARLLNELRQRTDDLTESLQQQTATSDILEVISNSPTDSQPAFDAIVRSGLKLFPDAAVVISLPEGDRVKLAAIAGADAGDLEALRARYPMPLSREFITGTAIIERREMDFADAGEAPEHLMPGRQNFLASGYRAITVMPMMRGEAAIGAISVIHRRPRQLSDKQRELLRTFASQAVIAIENTRLFSELRERTDDLTESLEQQTASGEILASISGSMADTKPVFDAIVRNLKRLFGTRLGMVQIIEDGMVHLAAASDDVEFKTLSEQFPRLLDENTGAGRAMISRQVVQFVPVVGNPDAPPSMQQFASQLGFNATLFAPMVREGKVIGAIGVARDEAKAFSDKQVELIKTFAAQAVIAIENTRLFNELRERTEDLTESLEQQTATAEVLSVMSRSKFDLEPILQSVVDTAARLCRAEQAGIFRLDQGVYRFAAAHSLDAKYLEFEKATPYVPGPGTVIGRAAMTREVAQVDDVLADPLYEQKNEAGAANIRSAIGVPLMREGEAVGVIALGRGRVEPFTEREIELVTTFADQAVIAIENVRLFDEVQARTEDLQESLQQQTATADVLKVISRSTFDLQTVLYALIESAAKLCRADRVALRLLREGAYQTVALHGYSPEHEAYMKSHPTTAEPSSMAGRAIRAGKPVQIDDITTHPDLTLVRSSPGFEVIRTLLAVPLLREGAPIGVLVLSRERVEPFSEKQIDLVNTFADQAVIAIENVRLFDEIQEKSRQLEEASKHKSQFLANMSHELRTPLNAILGYTELIVDGVYGETSEKVQTALKRITTNGKHLLGLINDVLDLSKIEAGQLTLSLTDYSMKDVVYAVYGAVEPLAAEKKLSFKAEIAPDMPAGHGDERRLTQVLLNLVGNAIKFTDEGEVKITASAGDDHFSVAVVDTGPGISEDDQKKLFQEFQQADSSTTKKKGGTGLGLAISKKIIEMHGGQVRLESKLGEGSTFSFTLPLRAEQAKRQA